MTTGQRKKVLLVITQSVWGGAQKYVYDIASRLPREQFDVTVALGGAGELYTRLQEARIPLVSISHFQRSMHVYADIRAFFEVVAILRRVQPDIVHVNSSKAGGITACAARLTRIIHGYPKTIVFTAHGWAYHENRPQWQKIFIRFASAWTAALSDIIITVSDYDKMSAITHHIASAAKLITIHNGITDIPYKDKDEAQRMLLGGPQSLVIGTLAEWTHNKGLPILLEACKSVHDALPHMRLVLMGWGKEKSLYEHIIHTHHMEAYVTLKEHVPHAARYLTAYDIFVLPSLKEGFPYALLEAGLASCPVIATRVGGIPEIIEHEKTGILVPPGSKEALASHIIQLAQSPELRISLGNALHDHVKTSFPISRMIESTISLYNT